MSEGGPSRRREGRDPWEDAPVGELSEQLLPRWFVLLALILVPVAIVAAVAAFLLGSGDQIPLAERRPPPVNADVTHEIGQYQVGQEEPVVYDAPCADLEGFSVAGTADDQTRLRQGLAVVCNAPRSPETSEALQRFGEAGGVVRFGLFEATGVDAVVETSQEHPRLLVNARYTDIQPPRAIGPLVAHGAVTWAGDPSSAETALAARQAEAAVCDVALTSDEATRACDDAEELLALPDPLAALRDAGFE